MDYFCTLATINVKRVIAITVVMAPVRMTGLTLTNCVRHRGAGMQDLAVVTGGAGDTGLP